MSHGFKLSDATLARQETQDITIPPEKTQNLNTPGKKKTANSFKPNTPTQYDAKIKVSMEELVQSIEKGEKAVTERDIFTAFGMDFVYPENRESYLNN